jgi:hypothetical protein
MRCFSAPSGSASRIPRAPASRCPPTARQTPARSSRALRGEGPRRGPPALSGVPRWREGTHVAVGVEERPEAVLAVPRPLPVVPVARHPLHDARAVPPVAHPRAIEPVPVVPRVPARAGRLRVIRRTLHTRASGFLVLAAYSRRAAQKRPPPFRGSWGEGGRRAPSEPLLDPRAPAPKVHVPARKLERAMPPHAGEHHCADASEAADAPRALLGRQQRGDLLAARPHLLRQQRPPPAREARGQAPNRPRARGAGRGVRGAGRGARGAERTAWPRAARAVRRVHSRRLNRTRARSSRPSRPSSRRARWACPRPPAPPEGASTRRRQTGRRGRVERCQALYIARRRGLRGPCAATLWRESATRPSCASPGEFVSLLKRPAAGQTLDPLNHPTVQKHNSRSQHFFCV